MRSLKAHYKEIRKSGVRALLGKIKSLASLLHPHIYFLLFPIAIPLIILIRLVALGFTSDLAIFVKNESAILFPIQDWLWRSANWIKRTDISIGTFCRIKPVILNGKKWYHATFV